MCFYAHTLDCNFSCDPRENGFGLMTVDDVSVCLLTIVHLDSIYSFVWREILQFSELYIAWLTCNFA